MFARLVKSTTTSVSQVRRLCNLPSFSRRPPFLQIFQVAPCTRGTTSEPTVAKNGERKGKKEEKKCSRVESAALPERHVQSVSKSYLWRRQMRVARPATLCGRIVAWSTHYTPPPSSFFFFFFLFFFSSHFMSLHCYFNTARKNHHPASC